MTTLDTDSEEPSRTARHAAAAQSAAAAADPATTPESEPQAAVGGDPAMIGLPCFIVGSIALGLALVGYVPAAAVGASIPVILAATGLGLVIAAIWSASVGQSAVAGVFGLFAGFWLSYAALVLGLTHNWFGIVAADVKHTQGLFLISWLAVIVMLTLATLRLPAAFTVLFVLIDVALALVLAGTLQASPTVLHAGGVAVLAFAAVGMYLYFDSASKATGGPAFPLGRPLLHG